MIFYHHYCLCETLAVSPVKVMGEAVFYTVCGRDDSQDASIKFQFNNIINSGIAKEEWAGWEFNDLIRLWMFKMTPDRYKTHLFHDLFNYFLLCKLHVYQVNIHGYIFSVSKNANGCTA